MSTTDPNRSSAIAARLMKASALVMPDSTPLPTARGKRGGLRQPLGQAGKRRLFGFFKRALADRALDGKTPQRGPGKKSDSRKPAQPETVQMRVERIAKHFGFGVEDVLVADDLTAREQQRHGARRADVVFVVAIVEIGFEKFPRGIRHRHVGRPDVALQQACPHSAAGAANVLHQGRPHRRIDHRIAQPVADRLQPANVHLRPHWSAYATSVTRFETGVQDRVPSINDSALLHVPTRNPRNATPIWVRPAGNITFAFSAGWPISTRSIASRRLNYSSPGARGFHKQSILFFPGRPLDSLPAAISFWRTPPLPPQ